MSKQKSLLALINAMSTPEGCLTAENATGFRNWVDRVHSDFDFEAILMVLDLEIRNSRTVDAIHVRRWQRMLGALANKSSDKKLAA